jgi:hypothetical protein
VISEPERKRGFDYDDGARDAGDDRVAARKVACAGDRAERRFADHGALFADGLVQFQVLRRIGMIEAAGKHSRGPGLQRAFVRGGVEPAREAGDDGKACGA